MSPRNAFFLVLLCAGCAADATAGPEASSSAKPAATNKPAAAVATTTSSGSLATKVFGEPITEMNEIALDDITKDPSKFADQTVRVRGKVQAVCQSAGCWMEIGDDASRAHIKMYGHSFYVPKNSSGHEAIVQGKVSATAAKNECGSKDSCGGSENGALAKLEIVATGVEFVD